jgi:hypothetical protein
MKPTIFTVMLLIISSWLCKAQNELLQVDEQGKFIYYELVEAKGSVKAHLMERAVLFFKKPNIDLKLKSVSGDTVFIGVGKLIINKTLLVMSHPSGEILYHFQAEVKEGKYRFWLTDFNFVPYQRDRYGNFVATTTRGLPLENNPGKLNLAQWKEYQTQTASYALQFAKVFKDHMANTAPPMVPVREKPVVKKDW